MIEYVFDEIWKRNKKVIPADMKTTESYLNYIEEAEKAKNNPVNNVYTNKDDYFRADVTFKPNGGVNEEFYVNTNSAEIDDVVTDAVKYIQDDSSKRFPDGFLVMNRENGEATVYTNPACKKADVLAEYSFQVNLAPTESRISEFLVYYIAKEQDKDRPLPNVSQQEFVEHETEDIQAGIERYGYFKDYREVPIYLGTVEKPAYISNGVTFDISEQAAYYCSKDIANELAKAPGNPEKVLNNVLEHFGLERVSIVLANTINFRCEENPERFSKSQKDWAKAQTIPQSMKNDTVAYATFGRYIPSECISKLVSTVMEKTQNHDIDYCCLGNGLTVYDRKQKAHGDYKTVAHIDTDRTVSFYDEKLPDVIKQQIQRIAENNNSNISATQDGKVLYEKPPKQSCNENGKRDGVKLFSYEKAAKKLKDEKTLESKKSKQEKAERTVKPRSRHYEEMER